MHACMPAYLDATTRSAFVTFVAIAAARMLFGVLRLRLRMRLLHLLRTSFLARLLLRLWMKLRPGLLLRLLLTRLRRRLRMEFRPRLLLRLLLTRLRTWFLMRLLHGLRMKFLTRLLLRLDFCCTWRLRLGLMLHLGLHLGLRL